MERATGFQAQQAPGNETTALPEHRKNRRDRWLIGILLWVIGVAILATAAVIIHAHPTTWPVELTFTKDLQGSHLVPCVYRLQTRSLFDAGVDFINSLNDPILAVAIPLFWMVLLALFRRFKEALFVGVAVLTSSAVWFGIESFVARPRITTNEGICVHRMIAAFSFPSGHVIHDVTLYGFLLYLSFIRPVREWRYHWVLLPLQILAVLYMLSVGYARLEAGEHRLFDVLGAYLVAALWLFFWIALYRWLTNMFARRRAKKHASLA